MGPNLGFTAYKCHDPGQVVSTLCAPAFSVQCKKAVLFNGQSGLYTTFSVCTTVKSINILPQKLLKRCNFWKLSQGGTIFPTPSPAYNSALIGTYKS